MTQAAPAILSHRVRVGAELEHKLGLAPGADSGKVYAALVALTDNKSLDVRSLVSNGADASKIESTALARPCPRNPARATARPSSVKTA